MKRGKAHVKDLESHWHATAAAIEKVTDGLGLPIDEGIKEAVVALNCLGLKTSQSCFGHADRPQTRGPWINITTDELHRMFVAAQPALNRVRKYRHETGQQPNDPEWKEYIQTATTKTQVLAQKVRPLITDFNDATGYNLQLAPKTIGFVMITHARGAASQPPVDLAAAQKEMREFGRFARDRFFEPATDA